MTRPDEIKNMLLRGFQRFYSDGVYTWGRNSVQGILRPRGESFELDSDMIQKILKELEQEGHIKLHFEDEKYLTVLEPK